MDRFPPFNALLLWGATFYLATHGVLPPAATEAEARELVVALREASVADESNTLPSGLIQSTVSGKVNETTYQGDSFARN